MSSAQSQDRSRALWRSTLAGPLTASSAPAFYLQSPKLVSAVLVMEQLPSDADIRISRGSWEGRDLLLKSAHAKDQKMGLRRLQEEVFALADTGPLYHLWGTCVPALLYQGFTDYQREVYEVVLDFIEGSPPCKTSSAAAWQAATQALTYVHDAGVLHGNVCEKNIIVTRHDTVFFVNWGQHVYRPKAADINADDIKAEWDNLRKAFRREESIESS